ncbi:hypothetical protein TGAMA5MH_03954 [Trichoderma gamsii]|uniref:DUF6594 domain-containing protein n=1 Tax=Trichoderma gamsii TaxID=398673 RepID=A0A2K0TFN9_9HYPO|nr:hypothetical protein TGAMA5MH_03954 [Trichoderma gamsii]
MDSSSQHDLELGQEGGPSPEPSRCKNRLSSWVKAWVGPSTATKEASTAAPTENSRQNTFKKFPQGYPRFSALIASHRSFHLCRRFSALRTRLLLVKQDRLTVLEKRLEKLDRGEVAKLSLGTCRADKNEDRHAVLAEMDAALADYDAFLERHHRALSFSTAPARPVSTLWKWVDGTGCVARAETAYLEHGEDLVSLATPEDSIVTWLETLAEYASLYFHKQPGPETSQGPDVYIFPPSPIRRAVQIILAPLFTLLLLIPVIICNFLSGLTARLIIVILSTTGFIAALSCLTNIRPVDLIIAGAT